MLGSGSSEAGFFEFDLLTLLQNFVFLIACSELLFGSFTLTISLFILSSNIIFFFDAAKTSFFIFLKDVPSLILVLLNSTQSVLFLELESLKAQGLLLLEMFKTNVLRLLESCEA